MKEFFDQIYCLNQESRPDRWAQAEAEFNRVGIPVQRFLSLPADQPNKSFCLSQYAMLKKFLASGGKRLMTFEDDALFKNMDHLPACLNELPADWDVIYLGANLHHMVFGITENPPVKYSEHLVRVKRAWTSHAIGYSRKMVEAIIEKYPVESFEMYDNWLSSNMLEHYNCFITNPMICWQRPGKSDLWNADTDYTGAFEWGDKFMRT